MIFKIKKLLFDCGFSLNEEYNEPDYVLINTQPHHLIDESDRLLKILKNHRVSLEKIEIKSVYEPSSGEAYIHIWNISDSMLDPE